MSMVVNRVYRAYADNGAGAMGKKQKAENTQNGQTQKADAPQLSSKAQAYLNKLNQSYDNMEFLVYNSSEDAKEVLSHSTKEVSVMLSSDELERMASDEKYAAEKMKGVQGALRMSEQINREFGFTSAFDKTGENAGTKITKVAFSFNEDGSTNIFAELEKSRRKQREQLEEAIEEKRAQKKAADRYSQANAPAKRMVVEAGSVDELMKKIAKADWSGVRTESGDRFDFSI